MASPWEGARLPRPFGRYQLLDLLGEGGMASVYRAELTGPGGFTKKVAIKQIHPHLSRRHDYRTSFLKEARLGGMLTHPNVVQILDFGECDGQLYLAMELVEGVSLDRVLGLHRGLASFLPDWVVLQLGIQLCQGLAYAHQLRDESGAPLRLVHRDLKPSNLLLSRFGTVKLADFGIARADVNLASTLESGVIKGTTLYMSPEQALGVRDLDARSDLFAVGLILFELYTLRPFHRAGMAHLALQQAQLPDVDGRLRELPPGPLTEGLREVLRRVLRYTPEERFGSAQELLRALSGLVESLNPPGPDLAVAFPAWCEQTLQSLLPASPLDGGLETAPYTQGGLEHALASWGVSSAEGGGETGEYTTGPLVPDRDHTRDGTPRILEDTQHRPDERARLPSDRAGLTSEGQGAVPGSAMNRAEDGRLASPGTSRVPGSAVRERSLTQSRWGALVWGAAFLSVSVALRVGGILEPLDRLRQDTYALHVFPPLAMTDVLVVDLDDDVEAWPWKRVVLARLIERLLNEGEVQQIQVDVVLAERSSEADVTRLPGNQRLAELSRSSGKVVFADGGLLEPLKDGRNGYRLMPGEPLAQELSGLPVGFAAFLAQGRGGGPVRRTILMAQPSKEDQPPVAFSLAAAGAAAGRPVQVDPELHRLNLGATWLPTDAGFGIEIPPINLDRLTALKASELLKPSSVPPGLVEQLRGKWVLLGRYADPFLDRVATPWGYRPGVALQAAVTAALLEGRVRYRAGVETELFLQLILLGMALGAGWLVQGHRLRLYVGLLLGTLGLEALLLRVYGMWLGAPVAELLGLALLAGVQWAGRR